MKRVAKVRHLFVTHVPETLEDGVVYVAMDLGTVVHRCCCGCGLEVVTPLSPTDWSLTYDGESISLNPSIGNWSFPCRSHYWIENNEVSWAEDWSVWRIEAARRWDQRVKRWHYGAGHESPAANRPKGEARSDDDDQAESRLPEGGPSDHE